MTEEKVYELKCDGKNHRVMVDVVTFIEMPDERFMYDIYGDKDKIKQDVAAFKAKVNPNASVYYDYCCEECKEATSGS